MHPNAFQHILSSSGIVQRRYIFTKDQYSILPKQYKYNINIQNDQQTYNVGSKGQLTSMDHPSLRHVAPFIQGICQMSDIIMTYAPYPCKKRCIQLPIFMLVQSNHMIQFPCVRQCHCRREKEDNRQAIVSIWMTYIFRHYQPLSSLL